MQGPIDFIIVGFEGNKFDGSILAALTDALDKGIIGLVALTVFCKDEQGVISALDVADAGDEYLVTFSQKYKTNHPLEEDDALEVSGLLKNNTTAGVLIIEHLWAKPLKEAIVRANGVLVAEGRIHPETARALDKVA
jgi:hypothetical protein